MTATRTYLDYNATAPLRPEARAAVAQVLESCGNPSSVHAEGRRARAVIERARAQVAALVGVLPHDVIFTSGGTEANVTALSRERFGAGEAAICLVSAVEHPSVLAGGRFGAEAVRHIGVGGDGVVDMAAFEAEIGRAAAEAPDRPIMVSVMVANNETGAVQPVAEIARIAHDYGATVHADAVQAAGKIGLDMAALGADMISLSAHKLGGPQGVGALVLRAGFALARPLLTGGGQEQRRRAGTENLAGIAGFGAAAMAAVRDLPRMAAVATLRDRLEAELVERGAVIFAQGTERLPNTSLFAVPGLKAETAVIGLDLAGVAVSSGAACSSGKVQRSHVLEAMNVQPDLVDGAIRISLGWETSEVDIERMLSAWSVVAAQAGASRPAA